MAMRVIGPSHARFKDLSGFRFGRLTVLRYAGRPKRFHLWECHCQCGRVATIRAVHLCSGNTESCGCLRLEHAAKVNTKHGGQKTNAPEWRAWSNMIRRCQDSNAPYFADYGGRGIKVCARWRLGENGQHGYLCFLADLGLKPDPTFTLDRIDVNGDYEPGNCRWLSRADQQMNRRSTIKIVVDGERISFFDAIQQQSPTLAALRVEKGRGLTMQEIFDALRTR